MEMCTHFNALWFCWLRPPIHKRESYPYA